MGHVIPTSRNLEVAVKNEIHGQKSLIWENLDEVETAF